MIESSETIKTPNCAKEKWWREASEKWRTMTWQGRQGALHEVLPTERYGEVYENVHSPYLGDLNEENILALAKLWGFIK